MKSSYSKLVQSKFFNPAFNSAIFDGPLRIYFAQFHESLALKIYFMAQQELASELALAKEQSKLSGANILVMIYPTEETFAFSFEEGHASSALFKIETWNEDVVIGLRGPLPEEKLDLLLQALRTTMQSWSPGAGERTFAPLEL